MDEIYLRIPGKPIAKKTHRYVYRWRNQGGKLNVKPHSYFPQKEEQEKVRAIIKAQYRGKPLDTALFVQFIFHMPIPVAWNATQKIFARDGRLLPIGRPDATNLAKFYEDCMNGIVYTDDSRIVWVTPIKKYDDETYTEIIIRRFEWQQFTEFQRVAATAEV